MKEKLKSKYIGIRLTEEEYSSLSVSAEQNSRNISEEIRDCLRRESVTQQDIEELRNETRIIRKTLDEVLAAVKNYGTPHN